MFFVKKKEEEKEMNKKKGKKKERNKIELKINELTQLSIQFTYSSN